MSRLKNTQNKYRDHSQYSQSNDHNKSYEIPKYQSNYSEKQLQNNSTRHTFFK